MKIVTQGFGNAQMLVTKGYGGITSQGEIVNLRSIIDSSDVDLRSLVSDPDVEMRSLVKQEVQVKSPLDIQGGI